jgi:hypothetical protein
MGLKFNVFTGNFDYTGSSSGTYFTENGNTLELHWNGSLVHSWTVTPVAPVGRRASLWFLLPNN